MISAEELSLEIRESDDSLHNIFLKNGLSLATAFKLLEKTLLEKLLLRGVRIMFILKEECIL